MTVDASSSRSSIAGSDPQTPPLSSGTRRAARIGWWTLGTGVVVFLLWAALAPLDEGGPMPGQVSLDTKRKPVQHLAGGIVSQVRVQEGVHVDAG
jgi:protease secretion system membrane fusion protein